MNGSLVKVVGGVAAFLAVSAYASVISRLDKLEERSVSGAPLAALSERVGKLESGAAIVMAPETRRALEGVAQQFADVKAQLARMQETLERVQARQDALLDRLGASPAR